MIEMMLLAAGLVLLGVAALTGFLQVRATRGSAELEQWRVVHNGGTAGGVQLLALAAVWSRLAPSALSPGVAMGVTAASWAFFLGPLARALGQRTLGNRVNLVGALFAAPAYLALPLLLVLQ